MLSELEYPDLVKKIETNVKHEVQLNERVISEVSRVKRNYSLPDKLKKTYSNTCQICNVVLESPRGAISVGAHIKGLGKPHSGPDSTTNMLCLCPNHHAQFDAFSFYIEPSSFEIKSLRGYEGQKITKKHNIDSKFLAYHKGIYNEKNSKT